MSSPPHLDGRYVPRLLANMIGNDFAAVRWRTVGAGYQAGRFAGAFIGRGEGPPSQAFARICPPLITAIMAVN